MPYRILIVEDEFLMAFMLADMVTDLGYECLGPASTLASALQLADAEPIEAALINPILAGEPSDAVCNLLDRRRIPFAFIADGDGPDRGRWRDHPTIGRPLTRRAVRGLMRRFVPH